MSFEFWVWHFFARCRGLLCSWLFSRNETEFEESLRARKSEPVRGDRGAFELIRRFMSAYWRPIGRLANLGEA